MYTVYMVCTQSLLLMYIIGRRKETPLHLATGGYPAICEWMEDNMMEVDLEGPRSMYHEEISTYTHMYRSPHY